MAYYKNAVVSFNGMLYFHLYKDDNTGILTSLSQLASSSLTLLTIPTTVINENLTPNHTNSALTITNTFPLNYISKTSSPVASTTFTTLTSFITFIDRTYSMHVPAAPVTLYIEAPCTSVASTYDYSLVTPVPTWLTNTLDSFNST